MTKPAKICGACGKPIKGKAYRDGKNPVFGYDEKGRYTVLRHEGTRWIDKQCKDRQDYFTGKFSRALKKIRKVK